MNLMKKLKPFLWGSGLTPALPLDIFRIGTGFLSFIYFLRSFIEAPFFMGHNSLIDHELVQEIFWFTWQPLFFPTMGSQTIQLILGLGLILSVLLFLGMQSRLSAFLLYFIVVCSYRFHFLVFFVDDVVMHLLLFWCFILPTGKTLNLLSLWKDKKIIKSWLKVKVDRVTINLVLINIFLLYFVAGASKFTSPLWLEGKALFAVMKLPMGWFTHYPLENFKEWLILGNYLALGFEPLFALVPFLPAWSKPKIVLGSGLLFFHLFIIATLDVPFANIGCLIFIPIIFRDEVMSLIQKKIGNDKNREELVFRNNVFANNLARLTVIFLLGAMMCALTQKQWRTAKRVSGTDKAAEVKGSSADSGGTIQTFFYGGLWVLGLAQGYRLLDWIDERNFHQKVSITERTNEGERTFGRSKLVPIGMRGSLIMTYVSDITWMHIPPDFVNEIRLDVQKRLSRKYCQSIKKRTYVVVTQALTKIESFMPRYEKPEVLQSFTCENFQLSP